MNTTAASMDFCAASTKATRKNSSPPRFSAPESSSHACMRSVPSRRMRRTHAAYTKASGAFRRRSDHFCAARTGHACPKKSLAIYRFAAKLYREGKPLLQRLSDETYHPLLRAVRQLNGELEQYRGFVRFSDIGGVLAAEIEPKNRVLPLLRGHFCQRCHDETFFLYDRTHREALFYADGHSAIVPLEEFVMAPPTRRKNAIAGSGVAFMTPSPSANVKIRSSACHICRSASGRC